MKFASAILLTVIVALSGFTQDDKKKSTKANKPDFSGKWELDAAKSEAFKGIPVSKKNKKGTGGKGIEYPFLLIEHRDSEVIVTENGGQFYPGVKKATYYSDGRGETNPNVDGTSVDSKTKWDGKTLLTTVFRKSETGKKPDTIVLRETWKLSKDGRTLTIVRTPVDPRGGPQLMMRLEDIIRTSKMVYHRAQD